MPFDDIIGEAMIQGKNGDGNEGRESVALRTLIYNPVMDRLTMFIIRAEGSELSLLIVFRC